MGHQEFFFLAIWWAGYFFPFFPISSLLHLCCMQFFSSDKRLQEIFFQNHPPPRSRVKWLVPNIDSTPSAHFETTQLTLARRLRSTLSSGLSRIASIVFSYDHLDTNDDSDLADHTVEPLHNGHLWEQKKVAVMGK